jgi:hypothetical protein
LKLHPSLSPYTPSIWSGLRMVQILCTHLCKWKNDNYSRNEERGDKGGWQRGWIQAWCIL